MSKTIKNKKGIGYDFWSRRCFGCFVLSHGKIAKMITKQKERTRNKKLIKQAIENPDNYEGRFPGE